MASTAKVNEIKKHCDMIDETVGLSKQLDQNLLEDKDLKDLKDREGKLLQIKEKAKSKALNFIEELNSLNIDEGKLDKEREKLKKEIFEIKKDSIELKKETKEILVEYEEIENLSKQSKDKNLKKQLMEQFLMI